MRIGRSTGFRNQAFEGSSPSLGTKFWASGEMADALGLSSSIRDGVRVRLSWGPPNLLSL